jgi:osmotically-inducible protein OsmY
MSQDSQLQHAVLSELSWEPSVTAAHIGVSANAGVVTLTGEVDSFAQKHAAEAAARRVRGVRAVAEEMQVRLPFDAHRSDEQIAAAAIERLSWNALLPKNSVRASVEHGCVTLTGEVGFWYQKDAAEQDIRPLHGVVGVWNQITIKPAVNASGLSDDITHALHRSWFFDPQTTFVRAEGGKVVLSGTVHSLHERELAAKAAWAAPGVVSVENDIIVSSTEWRG